MPSRERTGTGFVGSRSANNGHAPLSLRQKRRGE
jgi:hypothetical protein